MLARQLTMRVRTERRLEIRERPERIRRSIKKEGGGTIK